MLFLTAFALAQTPATQAIELVHQVEPRFPREARKQRVTHAECSVLVRVTPEGVPDDLHVVACDEMFVASTLTALEKWRFTVTPPAAAQFRVVVVYDYPKKEGGHVSVEPESPAEALPEPPMEPVPAPADLPPEP